MSKDVVCGMNVDEKKTQFKSEYMGQKYFFCSTNCKQKFDKEPRQFMTHIK